MVMVSRFNSNISNKPSIGGISQDINYVSQIDDIGSNISQAQSTITNSNLNVNANIHNSNVEVETLDLSIDNTASVDYSSSTHDVSSVETIDTNVEMSNINTDTNNINSNIDIKINDGVNSNINNTTNDVSSVDVNISSKVNSGINTDTKTVSSVDTNFSSDNKNVNYNSDVKTVSSENVNVKSNGQMFKTNTNVTNVNGYQQPSSNVNMGQNTGQVGNISTPQSSNVSGNLDNSTTTPPSASPQPTSAQATPQAPTTNGSFNQTGMQARTASANLNGTGNRPVVYESTDGDVKVAGPTALYGLAGVSKKMIQHQKEIQKLKDKYISEGFSIQDANDIAYGRRTYDEVVNDIVTEQVENLRNSGFTDTDISRLLTGEITYEELFEEIMLEKSNKRRKPLIERMYAYNAELLESFGLDPDDYDFTTFSEIKKEIREHEKRLQEIYDLESRSEESLKIIALEAFINRLNDGVDLEIALQLYVAYEITDEDGYKHVITDGDPAIENGLSGKSLTVADCIDPEMLEEIKKHLESRNVSTGLLGMGGTTTKYYWDKDNYSLKQIAEQSKNKYNEYISSTREGGRDAFYIDEAREERDKIAKLKLYYETNKESFDFYMNWNDKFTHNQEEFNANKDFDTKQLKRTKEKLDDINKRFSIGKKNVKLSDKEAVQLLSCLINGEISLDKYDINFSAGSQYLENYIEKWYKNFTPEEVEIINYLYNTEGYKKVIEYLEANTNIYDQRYYYDKYQEDKNLADDYPILTSLASVGYTPVEGMVAFGYSIKSFVTKEKLYKSNIYSKGVTYRQTVSSNVHTNYGEVWGFIYDTGMSMYDSIPMIALSTVTGGTSGISLVAIGSVTAGARAYPSVLIDCLERGLSDNQAIGIAFLSSVAEVVMESWSVGHLLNLDAKLSSKAKDALSAIAKKYGDTKFGQFATVTAKIVFSSLSQSITGSEEEATTEIVDFIIDKMIAKDKSHYDLAIKNYMENDNMSESEAMFRSLWDEGIQVGLSALGGWISEGVFGGVHGINSSMNVLSSNIANDIYLKYENVNKAEGFLLGLDYQLIMSQAISIDQKLIAIDNLFDGLELKSSDSLFSQLLNLNENGKHKYSQNEIQLFKDLNKQFIEKQNNLEGKLEEYNKLVKEITSKKNLTMQDIVELEVLKTKINEITEKNNDINSKREIIANELKGYGVDLDTRLKSNLGKELENAIETFLNSIVDSILGKKSYSVNNYDEFLNNCLELAKIDYKFTPQQITDLQNLLIELDQKSNKDYQMPEIIKKELVELKSKPYPSQQELDRMNELNKLYLEYEEKIIPKYEKDIYDLTILLKQITGKSYNEIVKNNQHNNTDIQHLEETVDSSILEEYKERFEKAAKFMDVKDVAEYFGDAQQYLYQTLESLKNIPEVEAFLNQIETDIRSDAFYRALNPKSTKPHRTASANYPLFDMLNFLAEKYLSGAEIDFIVSNADNVNKYSFAEKSLINIFTAIYGPILATYNRQTDVVFSNHKYSPYDAYRHLRFIVEEFNKAYGTNLNTSMSVDDFNKMMDNIIEDSVIEEDMIVYRGTNGLFFNNQELVNLKPGTRFNDAAHTSTSATMTHMVESEHKFILKILLPKGTHAAYIESFTGVSGYNQQEILLPRNTTFEILSNPEIIGYDENKKPIYSLSVTVVPTEQTKVDAKLEYLPDVSEASRKYAEKNGVTSGIDINQLVDEMDRTGLLDYYNRQVLDMKINGLYEGIPSIGEHSEEHVKLVLLYSLYLAQKANISGDYFKILTEAAKYHDTGIIGMERGKHSGHSYYSVEKTQSYLRGSYSQQDIDKICLLIEFHELSGSEDIIFSELCKNYNITDPREIAELRKIGNILKDADALDRVRFINNFDASYLRSDDSRDIVLSAYQMREVMAKQEIDKILFRSDIGDKTAEYIYRLRQLNVPDREIYMYLKYHQNYSSFEELVDTEFPVMRAASVNESIDTNVSEVKTLTTETLIEYNKGVRRYFKDENGNTVSTTEAKTIPIRTLYDYMIDYYNYPKFYPEEKINEIKQQQKIFLAKNNTTENEMATALYELYKNYNEEEIVKVLLEIDSETMNYQFVNDKNAVLKFIHSTMYDIISTNYSAINEKTIEVEEYVHNGLIKDILEVFEISGNNIALDIKGMDYIQKVIDKTRLVDNEFLETIFDENSNVAGLHSEFYDLTYVNTDKYSVEQIKKILLHESLHYISRSGIETGSKYIGLNEAITDLLTYHQIYKNADILEKMIISGNSGYKSGMIVLFRMASEYGLLSTNVLKEAYIKNDINIIRNNLKQGSILVNGLSDIDIDKLFEYINKATLESDKQSMVNALELLASYEK